MDWRDELTRLIRRAQAQQPGDTDGAAMVVLARLRDALDNGREMALAALCLEFNPWSKPVSVPDLNPERTIA